MQGSSGQGGNQNGQKQQGGLSWTQSPSSGSGSANNPNTVQGGAKPISQVSSPLMPKGTVAQAAGNSQPQKNVQNSSMSNSNTTNKKNGERSGSTARTAGVFIAGVIVGLIIGWGWFSLGRDTDTTTATNTPTTSSSSESATMPATGSTADNSAGGTNSGTADVVSGSSALSIASMQTSGTQVSVSSVSVSVPTWVVIFEGINGKPGNALGAKMFFAGDKSGTVDLLRGTVAGQTYFAGEYVDNGDHQFSKATDSQVTALGGSPMLVQFTTR